MNSLRRIIDAFIERPWYSALKYSLLAAAGSFVFVVISLFSGQFDVTVPFNGLFVLLSVQVAAFVRFLLYMAADRILGVNTVTRGVILVGEIAYLVSNLYVAWDVAHPQNTQGAFAMLSLFGHFLIIPLALIALAIIGTIYGVRALAFRYQNARAGRVWRDHLAAQEDADAMTIVQEPRAIQK